MYMTKGMSKETTTRDKIAKLALKIFFYMPSQTFKGKSENAKKVFSLPLFFCKQIAGGESFAIIYHSLNFNLAFFSVLLHNKKTIFHPSLQFYIVLGTGTWLEHIL